MGLSLTDISSSITNAHKRIITNFIELNPTASLHSACAAINELPEMMTCHTEITPDLLVQLGFSPPGPETIIPIDNSAEARKDNGSTTSALSIEVLRKQLEIRHQRIQEKVEDLILQETLSTNQLKVMETLLKIDDNVVTKLLELMGQESTPVLPQAIIIACLRRHGVPEGDIKTIEDFKVVA